MTVHLFFRKHKIIYRSGIFFNRLSIVGLILDTCSGEAGCVNDIILLFSLHHIIQFFV